MIPLLFLSLTLLVGLTTVSAAPGDTIYVNGSSGNDSWDGQSAVYNSSGSGPKKSIKNATGTVNVNGTIHIANGQYAGENNTNITIDKNLNIFGESQTGTIINGTGTNWIFRINSGVNVTITNLTLTNAIAGEGGAIYNNGTLTVTNCTFTNNTANSVMGGGGGAILNDYGGTISSLNGCNFNNNTATYYGGAIHNKVGTISSLSGCNFNNNTSTIGPGGAISNWGRLTANYNRFYNTGGIGTVIYNSGDVSYVNVDYNWWGSNSGPSGQVWGLTVSKWLVLTVTPALNLVHTNSNLIITADLRHDNSGVIHTDRYVPDGTLVKFTTTLGTISSPLYMVEGLAQSTLSSGSVDGIASVSAAVNGQTVNASIFVISAVPPTAGANVKTGLYNTTKYVTLSMSKNGNIYYTVNGSTPTAASIKYTGPISVLSTTTLKFVAVDLAGNKSPVYTRTYIIDKKAPKVDYTYPKNKATKISRTSAIYLKFSEKIKEGVNWSKIYVKDRHAKKVKISKSIKNNMLYIKTSKRSSNSYYTVYIPVSAVKDYAGNTLVKVYTFRFKTGK